MEIDGKIALTQETPFLGKIAIQVKPETDGADLCNENPYS